MSIIATCEACGKRVNAPDRLAGKRAKCKCGGIVTVPAAVPASLGGLDDLAAFESKAATEAAGVGISSGACPSCSEALTPGAVLCVACGFDLRRGTRASTAMETAAAEPEPAKKGKPAKTPNLNNPGSGAAGKLVKFVFILAFLGGLGYGAYYMKESLTFDPEKQRDDDHAKIYPGMTVTQVVDAMGRRPKDVFTEREATKDKLVQHLPKRLNYVDDFMKHYEPRVLRYGFWFVYRYSERSELVVYFTADGKVHSAVKNDPLKIIGL
jgi:hypothetical protein